MNDQITWILIANTYEAKLYSANKLDEDWSLVEHFIDPAARENNLDIVSDKPGRYRNAEGPKSAMGQRSDPREVKIDNFARKLARRLNAGRSTNTFGKIIFVAPPHFYGQLRKHLDSHVEKLITQHIEKEYTHKSELEIIQMIRQQLK